MAWTSQNIWAPSSSSSSTTSTTSPLHPFSSTTISAGPRPSTPNPNAPSPHTIAALLADSTPDYTPAFRDGNPYGVVGDNRNTKTGSVRVNEEKGERSESCREQSEAENWEYESGSEDDGVVVEELVIRLYFEVVDEVVGKGRE